MRRVYLAFCSEARIVVLQSHNAFLFFDSRTCDVAVKLSQEKIELPAGGAGSDYSCVPIVCQPKETIVIL